MYVPEIEISVTYKSSPDAVKTKLTSSADAYALSLDIFSGGLIQWCEEFIMLSLNPVGEVIGFYKVSRGGMTSTVADLRVIATVALQTMATSVIVMHNHPSGALNPSQADDTVTEKLRKGLALLDVKLKDHLIITPAGYYSYADEGKI